MNSTTGVVEATFCGTSTVHVRDGVTSILIDGFFTRPSLLKVGLGWIAPDPEVVRDCLGRAGVTRLDALLVAHSHYDHALDAAEVVRQAGGTLYGSPSTLNIGRGGGVREEHLHEIADGDVLRIGDFTVRVIESRHSPGDRYPGTIDAPLRTPARTSAYRTGACFSFLLEHPQGSILIHPSAGFVPRQLDGLHADLLYLGVGALGAQSAAFQDAYWRNVVEATGPSMLVPVHWDDFFRPLSEPLRPLPPPFDRHDRTRELLTRKAGQAGIAWGFPAAFDTVRPFS